MLRTVRVPTAPTLPKFPRVVGSLNNQDSQAGSAETRCGIEHEAYISTEVELEPHVPQEPPFCQNPLIANYRVVKKSITISDNGIFQLNM